MINMRNVVYSMNRGCVDFEYIKFVFCVELLLVMIVKFFFVECL